MDVDNVWRLKGELKNKQQICDQGTNKVGSILVNLEV